jgi:hypothetical protein
MTSKTSIIAISGTIGAGKDTLAELIAEECKVACERHAWADKVRDVTEILTGYLMPITHPAGAPFFNEVKNYTQEDKEHYLPLWDKTIGQCLQLIGTEVFRERFDKDTWVKSLFSSTGKLCLEKKHILILPDTRFPNEADAVLERGGIVIRLEGDPVGIRANSTRDLTHASETSLDNYQHFTRVINNNVPVIHLLRAEARKIINDYLL